MAAYPPVSLPAAAASLLPAPADLDSEQLLPVGTRLGDGGRYSIVGIVAIGGMATVYRAVDSRLGGSACAIKALHRGASLGIADEEWRSFRDEARLLAGLRHPGIVAVRDLFDERVGGGEFSFIVQEFVDGQNLYDRHRRLPRPGEDPENVPLAPVPEDQAAVYGLALAGALEYLHTRTPPILYRDLKPHNIVRRASDGQLVLLDFGISRKTGKRSRRFYSDDLGTPGYAAPEQYERFGVLDERTDVYSLGVVLAELATGYNPRAEDAPQGIPAMETLGGRLSHSFAKILQRCVEADPAARFPNARAAGEALEQWRASPARTRRASGPERLWRIAPGAEWADKTHLHGVIRAVSLGAAGERYALTLPDGELRIVEATSGRTLASSRLSTSCRALPDARPPSLLAEPGGSRIALVMDKGAGTRVGRGSELEVRDERLQTIWRVGAPQERLSAAWIAPGSSEGASTSRLVAGSRRSNGGTMRSGLLACYDEDAQRRQWECVWYAALNGAAVILEPCGDGGGGLLALDAGGGLSRIDHAGAEVWHALVPRLRGSGGKARLKAVGGGPIALVCAEGGVDAFDLERGALLWSVPALGTVTGTEAHSSGGKLLAATRELGLIQIDARSGRVEQLDGMLARSVNSLARVAAGMDVFAAMECGVGARLILYDAARGKIIWEVPLPGLGGSGELCVSESSEAVLARESSGAVSAWRWSGAV